MTKIMSELHKLKTQWGVKNTLNAQNGLDTIQTLLLVLSLGNKVQIYQEEKGWTRLFKVLSIADANITIDIKNVPVTFLKYIYKAILLLYKRH